MSIVTNIQQERHPARLRRSVLTVPCVNLRAFEKIRSLDCDAVIFDLEDSVSLDNKVQARKNLFSFLEGADLGHRERIIRVNGPESLFYNEDIAMARSVGPDAILLPKLEDPGSVQALADVLNDSVGMEETRIWGMIETPRGVLNAASIASSGRTANSRLDSFVVGLNDLRKATGIPATTGRSFLVPYLMQIVLAARAYGLDVIDSVANDFRNISAFEQECAEGRAMGFDGKMLIHPSQIEPANFHFGPLDAEIDEARSIIAAFNDPTNAQVNVIEIGGRMYERLHIEGARKIVMRQAAISDRKGKTQ